MRRFICALLAIACVSSSWAVLDLELTQGLVAATPIAVESFQGDPNSAQERATLSHVIEQDCQNSGEFRVYTSPKQESVQHWQQLGATALVQAHVKSLSGNRFSVSLTLSGLYEQLDHPLTTLLSTEFVTSKAGVRRLAHHLSDLIYEKLTGLSGYFSTRVAYVSVGEAASHKKRYHLMVADQDGYQAQTLLSSNSPIMSPAWSPDNKQVAYVSFEGHRSRLYLQTLATGKRQLISAQPGINGAPSFSPDGRSLALVLSKAGQPHVYRYDVSTHVLTALTTGWSIDTEPSWSPDGKRVLFTSNRDGSPQIYQVNIADGQVSRLTFDGSYNARARWLPDGQGFVFMHRGEGGFCIAKQDLPSGQVQLLTQPGGNESPSVASNGRMILYTTHQGNHDLLARVSIDGQVHGLIHQARGDIREPAWSHKAH